MSKWARSSRECDCDDEAGEGLNDRAAMKDCAVLQKNSCQLPLLAEAQTVLTRISELEVPDVVRTGGQEDFREFHAPPLANPEPRLVLAFRRTPLKTVLSMVLRNALPRFGILYELEIENGLPDPPIDFTLVTGKPEEALQSLLTEIKRQAPKIQMELSPGQLKVAAREPAP